MFAIVLIVVVVVVAIVLAVVVVVVIVLTVVVIVENDKLAYVNVILACASKVCDRFYTVVDIVGIS